MAIITRMRVPQRDLPLLRTLAKMDDGDFSQLISIGSSDDPLPPRNVLVDSLERNISNLNREDTESLLSMVSSLYSLHTSHRWPLEDIAETASASEALELEVAEQERLRDRLLAVITAPAINAMGRAAEMQREHQNILHTARCITDLRPVFSDSAEYPPAGFVVSHQLKLEYIGEDGRNRAIHLGLGTEGVSNLIETLQREQLKAATLEGLLSDTGLVHIDVEEEP